MANTEKVTVNMDVVDLGKVDLMVEQGFYSNRTDFIKTSIRNQLSTHSNEMNHFIKERSYVIGINYYNQKELMKINKENKKLDIKVVGMLTLSSDIDPALALKTINSIKVLGVIKAEPKLKESIQHIIN